MTGTFKLRRRSLEKEIVMANKVPQKEPGKTPRQVGNDRTPPHKGDPEQVENVPGREQLNPHRRPDPDETYRTGRRGSGRT
jgi:hypothetical protein